MCFVIVFKCILYHWTETLRLGQPTNICCECDAEMWFEERPEKGKDTVENGFSLCCNKGKVELRILKKPPDLLINLWNGIDLRSKNFKENIRSYNSMFAFTSLGEKIQTDLNKGGSPPQFILSGQNYHHIRSLLPEEGCKPKFAQLYIYDTNNEIQNRLAHFR